MRRRKLFLLFLTFFICDKLFAATFTVTTNADAGAGSLRQALLNAAANGIATTDYIYFNLPGSTQADITIILKTQLPDVTSNVVIDGTTQPGPALGVSNAKVIITPAVAARNFDAFNVSSLVGLNDAVEFYGLYIKDFSPNHGQLGNGIVTNANCQLVVGSAGKGNVISGNMYAFFGYFQKAKIQANFIGLAADGLITDYNAYNLYSTEANFNLSGTLLIGGPGAADGNVIIGGIDEGIHLEGVNATATQSVTVENNFFGTDYTGTVALPGTATSIFQIKDPEINLLVYNNVFIGASPDIDILTRGTLTVKGNFFGTDRTQTHQLGQGYQAIQVVTGVIATIGGDAAADQNVFTNYYNPIFADNDANMLVIKNSFYCNDHVSVGNLIGNSIATITNLTDNSISGIAAPGALMQLYYANAAGCPKCNPTTWFANVTADANGNWVYNGNTMQNVLVSATVDNNTFGFQRYLIYPGDVVIKDYDCHHPGSIFVNQNRTGRIQFVWLDNGTGKVVGTGREIDNLPPGVYNLQINEGSDCTLLASGQFTINDLTPYVYSQTFQLDCNHATGSFTAIFQTASNFTVAKYYWEDSQGKIISTNSTVTDLPAGVYYLYITDSNGCNSAKVEYDVLPQPAAPLIDDSKVTVTGANCNFSDGSVIGITLTNGTNSNYGWMNAAGNQIAIGQLDLKNVPAGQYSFYVDYDNSCSPVVSRVFTVKGKNGINLDASSLIITPSTCASSNGAIKGIVVTGATSYQWFDNKNNIVGNSNDLIDVPSGSYYFVASNASCSAQTQLYAVSNLPAISNYPSTEAISDATCGLNNGEIAVVFNTGNAPKSYRWADASGADLIKNAPLTNAAAGQYELYVTDDNGCESLYKSYQVNSTPLLQIGPGLALITSDRCSRGIGSIQNVNITGGVPPYSYSWLNSNQQVINTSPNLIKVGHGTYTLQVKDVTSCSLATQRYTITNESVVVDEPVADNVQICSPGEAVVMVKNPLSGYGYRLYATATDNKALDEQMSGVFILNVSNSESFYITQFSGDCESQRIEVKIVVGLTSVNIPSAFTPNNDGINDLWEIKGLENYPNVLIRIFTRNGQKVFESTGYAHPFDGKLNGAALPSGVYYYIIALKSGCSVLSGSLTLIR
ncbi:gliding motility-associated C-terminal domain-containing protein [Mucilaginibacter sp.]|uniref:gliding motility-associated C-terminal domain-containing protein n=1 Tax=Mucilaginibacter sp. TaxID=1882438 RepID=UPI0028500226|nr:gliding motility-associated C-terminal domain-containing protein [Mucilaginibacter sp.]MDR3694276.1 gliding motility-associated C-terminal domain-containing protein [Mucilaginibacter sp.]